MDGFSSWAENNWFNLFQTMGIIGSLIFTGLAGHREAKAREIENLLMITEHHRKLWGEAQYRMELQRVFQKNIDLINTPPTVAEEVFLNSVIVHFQMGWHLSKAGAAITLKDLGTDAAEFFSRPLPATIWEKTKQFRNKLFVRFVELALKKNKLA